MDEHVTMKKKEGITMKFWLKITLFILGGAAFGYVYYLLFGCTGSCPITSSPVRTMLYFVVTGGLVGGAFLPAPKK